MRGKAEADGRSGGSPKRDSHTKCGCFLFAPKMRRFELVLFFIHFCDIIMVNNLECVIMSVFEKIYEVVKQIPCGKVATYGQVAMIAGNPRWARVVGYALHNNPDPSIIPCHRVVNREGRVAPGYAFGGSGIQKDLLEKEGIVFETDGHIDLEKYGI